MIDLTTLEPARAALDADGYRVSIGEVELAMRVPSLVVDLRAEDDDEATEWLLQVMLANDLSAAIDDPPGEPDLDDEEVTILQFTTVAPTLIAPEALAHCMRAAFLINTIMPIGSVGLIEAQQRFYFDYKLVLTDRSVSEFVLRETVSMMAFAAETYGTLLTKIAEGRMTVEELLKLLQGEGDAPN